MSKYYVSVKNMSYFKCTRVSDGYEEISNNQVEFAKKIGGFKQGVHAVLKGEYNTYKGWTFEYLKEICNEN